MAKKYVIPSIFTAIDNITKPVQLMGASVDKFASRSEEAIAKSNRKYRALGQSAFDVSKKSALMGAAIVAPLALAANSAIKFEDRMADVAKTTGLAGTDLEKYSQGLLDMSTKTRTSIEDLAAISEIGGQLGVPADQLLKFTEASNQFNVALGKDFGSVDEAVSQVGKIKNLFAQSRDMDISQAITRTGSAINQLGAVGAGTSANITDFTLRMGALPDALKPAVQNTLALGTYLEEMGINAQIGAGGLTNLLLVAGEEIGGFAKQMNISAAAAKTLLKEDPTEFVKKFSTSFQGLAPEVLAQKLKGLKLGSQETIKVIGALASGTGRLTELQGISAASFAAGTSLTEEYNKKNETTAARLAQAKNNMEAFSITVGTAVIPVVSALLEKITPVIQSFIDWSRENKTLVSVIIKVSVVLAALAFVISTVAFAIGIYSKAMLIMNAITLARQKILASEFWLTMRVAWAYVKQGVSIVASTVATVAATVAGKAAILSTKAWAAAQTVLNFILTMNPIGLVIVAIGLLVAAIAWVVSNTEGWGQTFDNIGRWIASIGEFIYRALEIKFLGIEDAFLTMVDSIVMAWKWGQNAIGLLSDEQYAKDKKDIQASSDARMAAIKNSAAAANTAMDEIMTGPEIAVRMKQSETPVIDQKSNQQKAMADQIIKGQSTAQVNLSLNDPRLQAQTVAPNVNVTTTSTKRF